MNEWDDGELPPVKDPRFLAAVNLLGHTGARAFQIRVSDDSAPDVWVAILEYGLVNGRPVPKGGHPAYKVGAGMDPLDAVFKLCDEVIDGARCVFCNRATAFSEVVGTMPNAATVCWYQWDPELRVYRRSCEEPKHP
jgi:hypothetical protein